MDCSLPGFSVHGIFQARILEWIAISFSRGSSLPRDRTWVSCIIGRCFTIWATREEYDSAIPLAYTPERNENIYRYIMWYMNVHSSTMFNSQNMETTQVPSTDHWVNKQNEAYPYNGVILSHNWSTDRCYIVDKSWKLGLMKGVKYKGPHIVQFHQYEISRTGK